MTDVQALFQEALDSLVEKLRRDPCVLAAVLLGSLSHDTVWEKSDIDLLIVAQDGKHLNTGFSLVEHGVNIHASMMTRSDFRKTLEGAVRSSFIHSMLAKGRLVYSRDETIEALFERRHGLGERDRDIRLLEQVSRLLPSLAKAEKWLAVRQDPEYSFFWAMKCLDTLASIEVLLNGEVTEREVVQQALRHNPALFRALYSDFIQEPKTVESVRARLDLINDYLRERIPLLFSPLLEHLAEAGGLRSASEINHHFKRQWNLDGLDSACEWLADEGVIRKLSAPVRLTEKSRVDVEEAAYYYEGDPV